ncbi:MAG: L-aspartate oxidase [Nocardioides sp.]
MRADIVVIGSGIAGLTAALRIHAEDPELTLLVLTKDVLNAGSTQWAQGGIAAALGPDDTPDQHEWDTLVAGAGACDLDAVRALVTEGPDAVRELIALGTNFDHNPDGELSLTREGGHHMDRILHAGGDATGAEIQRALIAAVERTPAIEVIAHALALDLQLAADGGVAGVTLHVMGEGQHDGVGAVDCRAVVLASGGLGQVFSQTTNPPVTTGDGMAMAFRAGAVLRDLEFVQFHPTVMYLGPDSRGQQPLISEAVRGEGAFLVDFEGTRFMQGQHELADLAPRDVVAKAITRRMNETGKPHMWLDARHLGAEFWEHRFPTILATCREYGVDPVTELIPVAPACHYASGGVATDLWGRTSVPGLYATGEVACSGVHGANRLASNSLLEGLVFSRRIAAVLPLEIRPWAPAEADTRAPGLVPADTRRRLQEVMTGQVGVLRSAGGLAEALRALDALAGAGGGQPDTASWETTNLLSISAALTAAATVREETRGSHWREDFPERDDIGWSGHIDATLGDDASPHLRFGHRRPTDLELPAGLRRLQPFPRALVAEIVAAGLDPADVQAHIAAALEEDLPGYAVDTTSVATIPAEARGQGVFAAREEGVVAGLGIAELAFRYVLGDDVEITDRVPDGTRVAPGDVVMRVAGPTRGLLTAERTALNFASHLSGIATATARWVTALEGTRARVLDTRKTLPGWRALQKYAVRCGGGVNHRFSLADMAMVKDNHVIAAGGVVPAFEAVRAAYPDLPVEVEVTDLDQLCALLEAGCDRILLDNMDTATMAEAVRIAGGRATLEASGGLTLERAREVAETGVHFISVGALTHSVKVFDLGLDLTEDAP